MEIIKELFLSILLPILLSAASAFFAAKFAFRKYKNEKSWEEKKGKYVLVIESVEYLSAWHASISCSFTHDSRLIVFDNDFSELNQSKRVLQKYAVIGQLYFSADFAEFLSELYLELEKNVYSFDENMEMVRGDREQEIRFENNYHASVSNCTSKALEELLSLAKKDLESSG